MVIKYCNIAAAIFCVLFAGLHLAHASYVWAAVLSLAGAANLVVYFWMRNLEREEEEYRQRLQDSMDCLVQSWVTQERTRTGAGSTK